MAITFAKPPINEVVLGQVFSQRPDFLIPHYGRFWELLAGDYPRVSHAQTIVDEDGGEPVLEPLTGTFLPRVWFLSDDETRLVQLQQDRLHVNWRQTETAKPVYPRFPAIKSEFDRVSELFDKYVVGATGKPVTHARLELTYINIISNSDAGISGPADFGLILRDFGWVKDVRTLPEPKKFAAKYEFDVDESTRLVVRISSARRISDNADLLRLELTAKENPGIKGRDAWIDGAHEVIVNSFKDLTTDEMHANHWQLISDKGAAL